MSVEEIKKLVKGKTFWYRDRWVCFRGVNRNGTTYNFGTDTMGVITVKESDIVDFLNNKIHNVRPVTGDTVIPLASEIGVNVKKFSDTPSVYEANADFKVINEGLMSMFNELRESGDKNVDLIGKKIDKASAIVNSMVSMEMVTLKKILALL